MSQCTRDAIPAPSNIEVMKIAQGKDKVTAKVLKPKKIKPVDRLIELLKPADHVILPAGHVVAEDEEFIQIPVADIHEVMAILEKM